MSLFNRVNEHIIQFVVKRPAITFVIALALSVYGLNLATTLSVETDYAELIPEDYDSVIALNKVKNTIGGGGSDVAVGIISPSFEATKQLADTLITVAMNMKTNEGKPYLKSVEYKRETQFLKENALYFATSEELNTIQDYLDEEIEESLLEANPFFTDLEDDLDEEVSDEGTDDKSDQIAEFENLYDWLVGNEYPIHKDGTSMTLRFFPEGSSSNVRYIDRLYKKLEKEIEKLDPKSFHQDIEIVIAGRLMHRSIQVKAIQDDIKNTFGLGASAVLILVLLYFSYKTYTARIGFHFNLKAMILELIRMPILALLIGLPLVMSLTWTFGLAALLIGNLNLMTSTLALLLFGLGIDFGVHFYGRYTEVLSSGKSVQNSIVETYMTTGVAIIVAASTTASAFFMLTFADFRGFSEFGLIAGTGILLAVVAMIIILPTLLIFFNKIHLLKIDTSTTTIQRDLKTNKTVPFYRVILGFSAVLVVLAFIFAPRVGFEYDFDKLDPRYPEFEAKKAIVDGYSSARRGSNPAYILTDSAKEAEEVAARIEEMKASNPNTMIKSVQTLQDRFPLNDALKRTKLNKIQEIRQTLNKSYFENDTTLAIQRLKLATTTQEAIRLEQIPEYLRDQFTTRDGELGTFVIIYPNKTLSNGLNSIAFANEVGSIEMTDGRIYHSGSTSIIAAEMLKLMQMESPYMIVLAFVIIFLLMLFHFSSFKWSLFALTPLIIGLFWMLLVMELSSFSLNFFNLIVLPALIGIANDDGVHLISRYRDMGKGNILKVIKTTGEHCTIATLTTMLGFLGLLFSFHPGLRTIGELALIGMITTLLGALVFLPALLQLFENKSLIEKEN